MSSILKASEDPVSERKKVYISERQIPALFEVGVQNLYTLINNLELLGTYDWSNEL